MQCDAIASGRAAAVFQAVIEAQGGNPGVVDDPAALPQAAAQGVFTAPRDGVVARVEPRALGNGVTAIGGGRTRIEDPMDPSAGFVVTARPGSHVRRGEPLATVHARDHATVQAGLRVLGEAIVIADEMSEPPLPLVSHRVTADGVEVLATPSA
jgi:thymidine phosphorylase